MIEDTKDTGRVFAVEFQGLLADTEQMMHCVADFLNIPFHKNMLVSTPLGVPWTANSSFVLDENNRGKVDPRPAGRSYWTGTDKMIIGALYGLSRPMALGKVLGPMASTDSRKV